MKRIVDLQLHNVDKLLHYQNMDLKVSDQVPSRGCRLLATIRDSARVP